ncbi:hypothetical protein HanXRQr2_Chr11g0509751 [Helianthus annuus]|uniref:Uncharacterized protein n=1 Tax=Helianthus annuus TaxID=4232 RepID=A0A9K3HRT4_HELAN|nr:hypothetical protein HanXRQr2_Chr11g0509751 [Helianthus annuus]
MGYYCQNSKNQNPPQLTHTISIKTLAINRSKPLNFKNHDDHPQFESIISRLFSVTACISILRRSINSADPSIGGWI